MSLYYALKSLKEIERKIAYPEGVAGQNEYSYGYEHMHRPDHMYGTNRSPVTGRYISNGTSPHGSMRLVYGDHYDHMYGHSIKDRMVARLEPMYDEAKTEHERQMISNAINQIQSNN